MTRTDDPRHGVGSWRELSSGYLGTCVALAGGVLIGAVNIYLAASLLPTAVDDIGGQRLYAWNTTVFLIAQVVATMLVSQVVSRCGNVGAYLIGFGVFAAGSVVCALSPTMPLLVVGRGVQGLAAGLLTGLGFGLIHSVLPRHLWVRGSALISAMFGIGNFVGPALGGLCAQFGSWRLAFAVLGVAALLMAMLVPRVLIPGARSAAAPTPVPVVSLGLVVAAVGAVSVAGIFDDAVGIGVCTTLALILIAAFLAAERRMSVRILPGPTYQSGSALRWVYLTIFFLACGVAVETFLPLFGQRLAGLPPLAAGFLAAALSFGWSVTQIARSTRSTRTIRRFLVVGPGLLAGAFAVLAVLQTSDASPAMALAWVALLVIGGAGIGLAMPHLSVAAMASTDDHVEGQKAGAAIATVLTMSTAFGAAIAGLLVNLGAPAMVASARYLLLGFAVICVLGVLTALRVNHLAENSVSDIGHDV